MNIYCGNISFNTSDDDLKDLFSRYGEVVDGRVVTDRYSGRSRGFGFVEMSNDGEAKEAIEALNGQEFMGRQLTINEARPREQR